jgi:hypothetical protein
MECEIGPFPLPMKPVENHHFQIYSIGKSTNSMFHVPSPRKHRGCCPHLQGGLCRLQATLDGQVGVVCSTWGRLLMGTENGNIMGIYWEYDENICNTIYVYIYIYVYIPS